MAPCTWRVISNNIQKPSNPATFHNFSPKTLDHHGPASTVSSDVPLHLVFVRNDQRLPYESNPILTPSEIVLPSDIITDVDLTKTVLYNDSSRISTGIILAVAAGLGYIVISMLYKLS